MYVIISEIYANVYSDGLDKIQFNKTSYEIYMKYNRNKKVLLSVKLLKTEKTEQIGWIVLNISFLFLLIAKLSSNWQFQLKLS